MRCSYCGGLNTDQAQFCVRCGKDMSAKASPDQTTTSRQRSPYPPPQPQQQPYPASYPPPPTQGYPRPIAQPAQQPAPIPSAPQRVPSAPTGQRPPVSTGQRSPTPPVPTRQRTTTPPAPAAPEPPATFPPRTMDHFKALEQGALAYTIVEDTETVGRKRIVRILYARCAPWQQMATLLKALKEQHVDKFNTTIIQGSYTQERTTVYGFTNGQLQFDRNVRLGSQTMNRYQVETGNGFEADSIRIVLSE